MSDPRVSTFEAGEGGLRAVGLHPSLALSSKSLPPGAYTTLRTYGGRGVVRLDQHLRRLAESVALQGLSGTVDPGLARRGLAAALDATGHEESRLRLTFSPPRLFVAAEPFTPLPPRMYEEGVACVTLDVRRETPHAKDTRFLTTAQEAYGRLPEGLLVTRDGEILEGLSSNFFAVVDGTLRTEEERALIGVTRSLVLEVAEGLLPLERRAVGGDERSLLQEAFLTSVSREVLPVVRIDGRTVGGGRPGPRTRDIVLAFGDLVRAEREAL